MDDEPRRTDHRADVTSTVVHSPPASNSSYFHYFTFGLGVRIDRLLVEMRREVFRIFIDEFAPQEQDSVLDVGVSPDEHPSSNFLEKHYPWTSRITALGVGDFSELEQQFPGLRYVRGDGRGLPFEDNSFDFVYSHAVIEHVGSRDSQVTFIRELARVARRGVLFTTPNRWHPIEFHTGLPMVHYLPRPVHHAVYRAIGKTMYASEDNHRLLGRADLASIVNDVTGPSDKLAHVRLTNTRWLGFPANLVVVMKSSS